MASNLLSVSGTHNTTDAIELIAAPGEQRRIVVVGFQLQSEATADNVITLLFGATTVYRLFTAIKGDGALCRFSRDNNWTVAKNTAVSLDLSAASTVNYTVWYFVI